MTHLSLTTKILSSAVFAAGLYLFFNVVVWLTDLAIDDACIGIWGQGSCWSHPEVVVATLIPAMIVTAAAWFVLDRGSTRAGIALLVVLIAASVFVTVRYELDCGDGLRIGIARNGPGTSPYWECFGGVR